MISIYVQYSTSPSGGRPSALVQAYGLSSDEKPKETDGIPPLALANGSAYVEMDTGKVYFYDAENQYWYAFLGGDS